VNKSIHLRTSNVCSYCIVLDYGINL